MQHSFTVEQVTNMSDVLINNSITVQQTRLEKAFELRKLSDVKYEGVKPLAKPSLNSRGVYGGNLCGQALLVAMETCEAGFTPHSLHSYFIKAGDDTMPCQFEVEKLNDGKNFANRLIRVSQKGQMKYIVMISLTKKNSRANTAKEYAKDPKKQSPFEFQAPVASNFYKYKHEDLPVTYNDHTKTLQHKIPPDFVDHKLNPDESKKSAAERDLSFWLRIDDASKDPKYKYAGFGIVSDSLYLTSLSRILHLPILGDGIGSSGGKGDHFFSVSLDHSIYFHDDSFDPSKWVFFNFSTPRFSNNRVLLQGGYYDENGKLFASIVQEGLVFFHSGSEHKAKL